MPHSSNACPLCGCGSIDVDEVAHGGPLWLAECARCAHRWTARAAPRATVSHAADASPVIGLVPRRTSRPDGAAPRPVPTAA